MRLSGMRNLRSGRRCRQRRRNHDELEAEMEDMTSMSESEIQAEMDEQVRKNQEADRKFMEYRRNTQGEVECGFRCEYSLTSSSFCAVTRRNIAAAPPFPPQPTALTGNDRAAVALERAEPDGSPMRPFPPGHWKICTGPG